MHVLIIPSEEFVPVDNHLAGIFQLHQAKMLQNAGYQVGVLSIKQSLSIPMIFKAMLLKLVGREPGNSLDGIALAKLPGVLYKKLFSIGSFTRVHEKEHLEVVEIDGFYYLPPKESRNYFGWIKAGISAFKKYVQLYGEPDIIHAHNALYAGMLARKIKSIYRIPFVITEHSSFVARRLVDRSLYPAILSVYNSADSFLVVSPFLGDKLENVFNKKIKEWKCIPNVLDPFFEKGAVPSFDIPNPGNSFKFISIGSLVPNKGHLELLQAFKKAFDANPGFKLMIGGDGDLKGEIENKITELGLSNSVILLDRLGREEVLELIDSAQCLVLSSHFETFGVVLIEALSRGKPVIATRCGGPDSIVNRYNGIQCEIGNISSMEMALKNMYSHYRDYNLEEIRNKTLEEYGEAAFTKNISAIYKDVLKHAG